VTHFKKTDVNWKYCQDIEQNLDEWNFSMDTLLQI